MKKETCKNCEGRGYVKMPNCEDCGETQSVDKADGRYLCRACCFSDWAEKELQAEEKLECSCSKCQECCWHNPGWFGSIEEVEGAAKIMNMPTKEFAKEYLIQEWWGGEEEDVSIPAPRRNFNKGYKGKHDWKNEIEKNGKGFVRASWGHNLITGRACIFLDDNNRCLIHKSKPLECKKVSSCNKESDFGGRAVLPSYWKNHQDFIKELAN